MVQIDLSGKTAVVTGGSGELGRVIARTLAQAGADVAVHYFGNQKKAEKVAEEIRKMGRKAISVYADVTELDSVMKMKAQIEAELAPPEIVVDAAVIQYEWLTVLEQPIEDYESQFKSCVLHNVNMAKAFIPHMIEKQYGRFIGINTECSMQMFPRYSAYASAKRGMDGVLRVLAKEVGKYQITVNQVAPGWMISDKFREHPADDADYISRVPMARRGEDQDIANAVLFLASDLAGFITGVYLPVCGGNEMPCI